MVDINGRLVPTKLGMAIFRSSLGPAEGLMVYRDLSGAVVVQCSPVIIKLLGLFLVVIELLGPFLVIIELLGLFLVIIELLGLFLVMSGQS